MAKVSLRAYNREIETMIDRGQLDEAIAHCHHIFKILPKHLETYRLLGKAYLEYKRYNDAVDIFTRVLVAVPNDFVANVGMSIIRDEESKLDDAIWHMERAFEVQPSNSAIQGELQRLYGRRDGVQPPRIRMTRGALAHMYVQGELYPQAISEIKSVLKEDGGRSDMQALLARAHYRSGQKNEAAEVASSLLRRYPYCLDANRVLAEILGVDKPENAKLYRDRVLELDPYAAHVNGTLFQANEALDAAVSIEHLDWNGQPVGASTQAEWRDSRAISAGSGIERGRDEQPDWLKQSASESSPTIHPQPKPASAFELSAPPVQPAQPAPADDIPDFMKEAGWGQSTGAFDESKSSIAAEERASGAQPLAQGDMPDWVKAMAPKQEAQPSSEEEMPDWINKIGPVGGAVAATTGLQSDDMDWLNQLGQPSQPESAVQSSEEQPDWMKQLETPASTPSSDQPDWLKGLDGDLQVPAQAASDQPDWLKDLSGEPQPTSAQEPSEQPDWMKGFGEETPSAPKSEESDWLSQFDVQPREPESKPETPDFSFLDELTAEQPAPVIPPSTVDTGSLGTSDQERDDSFAWLEGLAAKQGASEGLLTEPEERLEQEPDWVKQAKGVSTQPPVQEPVSMPSTPMANVDDLGKSQSEIDDSLAWLEGLAAKQGATEGLLVKPEERMEQEPDWIKKVKSTTGQLSEQKAPATSAPQMEESAPEPLVFEQPVANVDDLGKSQQEIDDSLAWLENLAAKQGATEGLLTKPEERMESEPDWVKKVKSSTGQLSEQKATETSAPQMEESTPEPLAVEQPVTNVDDLGKSQKEIDDSLAWLENLAAKQGATEGLLIKPEERTEQEPDWVQQAKNAPQPPAQPVEQPVPADDTAMWLRSLDAEETKPEPEFVEDETAIWLKGIDEAEKTPASTQPTPGADETAMWLKSLDEEPSAPAQSADLPSWMQDLDEEKPVATEPAVPAEEADASAWMKSLDEPVAQQEPTKAEEDSLPSWLSGLEKEEKEPEIFIPASQDDLPAWLRDETGEVVAEPVKIEPTRSTDWKPAEEKREEIPAPPPPPVVEVKPEPEPEPKPEPKPAKKAPAKTEVKPATPPEPYKEPVTRKGTGMLTMPIDPILHTARTELSRSNIPGALETYGKLIKKGRFLDEVIFDLREALYRYPVEVSIWQSLGDAYMRANRLQDALDAYTKAEELLR